MPTLPVRCLRESEHVIRNHYSVLHEQLAALRSPFLSLLRSLQFWTATCWAHTLSVREAMFERGIPCGRVYLIDVPFVATGRCSTIDGDALFKISSATKGAINDALNNSKLVVSCSF
jgi:hypothetical protein